MKRHTISSRAMGSRRAFFGSACFGQVLSGQLRVSSCSTELVAIRSKSLCWDPAPVLCFLTTPVGKFCLVAQEEDWVLPSGPVISNTWHLSDAFWNAHVSARQVGLFVPVTMLTLLWVFFSKRKMATRPEVPKETLDSSIWRLGSARP